MEALTFVRSRGFAMDVPQEQFLSVEGEQLALPDSLSPDPTPTPADYAGLAKGANEDNRPPLSKENQAELNGLTGGDREKDHVRVELARSKSVAARKSSVEKSLTG